MNKNTLKKYIKNNLNNTSLNIKHKHLQVLAMTCFWSKINFNVIVKWYGIKYYCYYDNSVNDIIIEYCR
jgi:hypothetical protein